MVLEMALSIFYSYCCCVNMRKWMRTQVRSYWDLVRLIYWEHFFILVSIVSTLSSRDQVSNYFSIHQTIGQI